MAAWSALGTRKVATLSALALAAACSVDALDLSGKRCPCADGWVCDPGSNTCVAVGSSGGADGGDGGGTGGSGGSDGGGAAGTGAVAGSGGGAGASGSGGAAGTGGATDAGADSGDGWTGCGASMKVCNGTCVPTNVANGCAGTSCDPCASHPNSVPACIFGGCSALCTSAFGDCDADLSNGCETPVSVSDASNCGKCARTCATNHAASTSCSGAACQPICSAGYGNCNESSKLVPDDGCETALTTSTSHCGRCGYSCSAQGGVSSKFTCFSGECGCSTAAQCLTEATLTGVSCDAALHRCVCGAGTCGVGEVCIKQGGSSTCACNGVSKCTGSTTCCSTGCKNLSSDPANCGVCGLICSSSTTCQAGKCV
ncbi:MAG: hypothetical protein IPI67_06390 [Myxococcales bacterium]|nr:hypothetical protein [Myxococcales bacterium]